MTIASITATMVFIAALLYGVSWFRKRQEKKQVKRELSATTYKLMGLVFELKRCQKRKDPVRGLVDFFALISAWHDQVGDIHELVQKAHRLEVHPKATSCLEELARLIQKYGRQEYGMNRTRPGEMVTKEKVYLGDIHGCWTKTVAELERKEDKLKAEVHAEKDGEKITIWDRYAQQAENLMSVAVCNLGETTRNASLAMGK